MYMNNWAKWGAWQMYGNNWDKGCMADVKGTIGTMGAWQMYRNNWAKGCMADV